MPGRLFVVATPIGNLDDVSARAVQVLRQVALIAAEDTRRTAHLLARYGITTPTTSVHAHNESRRIPAILSRLTQGQDVALVSDAGTPGLSDPGQRLVEAVRRTGLSVVPIPGPSALTTILMASGLPGVPLHFLGFPPIRAKDRSRWFAALKASEGTVVFFEAPHRILRTLAELKDTFGDVPVIVGREMTKTHEEFVEGPISTLIRAGLKTIGEFTVAVSVGQSANSSGRVRPSAGDLADEFGRVSKTVAVSRRQAIAAVAAKYGISQKAVYMAIEAAKNSGE
jgi:16S rRNA (cytidine1402-2'-O)-methyltransferase